MVQSDDGLVRCPRRCATSVWMCLVQESELQAQIAANGAVIDELRADARRHIESTLRKEEESAAAQASMWYVDGMNSS